MTEPHLPSLRQSPNTHLKLLQHTNTYIINQHNMSMFRMFNFAE